MNIADRFIGTVEGLADFFGRTFGSHASSFVTLETADMQNDDTLGRDCTTMCCSDGALFSGVRINGYTSCVGPDEINAIVRKLSTGMKTYFQNPGHVFQFWFGIDPSRTREDLTERMRSSAATSKALGLDMAALNQSKASHLAKFCTSESIYLGIWTTRSILDKESSKFEAQRRKDMKLPQVPKDMQDIFVAIHGLRQSHTSLVSSIMQDLNQIGVSCEIMKAEEVCRAARMSVAPDITPDNWRPILPGDRIPLQKLNEDQRLDVELNGYPSLGSQIIPYDGIKKNGSLIEVGDTVYAPMFIEIGPDEPRRFSDLMARVAEHRIPWRMSMVIEGGGEQALAIKGEVAGIFSWASQHNNQIYKAYKGLKEIAENEPVVRVKFSFCTWAPKDQASLIRTRSAQLAKSIASWGRCEVRTVSGDPMAGFMSSTCFLTHDSVATASYAPIEEVMVMAPLDRPASPWKNGSIPFRTMDGKIMPFEPGSSLQTTWNYIGFGSPGMGKSVLASTILMAVCQQAGIKRLPRIAITDIGPSSAGFISAIRDSLPERQKHLVTSFRLRMTNEFSINPCDTHLGLDFLLPDDKSFLVSLITLLATPAETGIAYDSMSSLVSKVVDIMYEDCSRKNNAKKYRTGICPEIDVAIKNIAMHADNDTTWWNIVDTLYERGMIHEATMAQRYAVPTISDAIAAARHSSIKDLYTDPKVQTTESLNAAFSRLIQDALRDYKILEKPTVFDIGEARIVSIDIDEVAPRGTPSADKQTAVMYMLSSYMMTKTWRLSDDPKLIASIPQAYREFHRKRIAEIQEDMKWDVVDEFHRASKVKAAEAVIADYVVRMREGRKWNRGVLLLSQSIGDYPKEIQEFISGVFALEAGTAENVNMLQTIFGFNDTAKRMLSEYANGPIRNGGGSPFLGIFKTRPDGNFKGGLFTQLLVNTISPIEIWSFSTTKEDRMVREGVFSRLGQETGREALAQIYPGGTIKAEAERLKLRFADASDEERDLGATGIIINEIVTKYEQAKNQEK